MTTEYNFDGLVGPTHNYAGLSSGNIASIKHREQPSNPREAALQGLEKAIALARMGVPQAVLPPLERPSVRSLRAWGFSGSTDADVLAATHREAPWMMSAASSASAMWTANACTVAPSLDTADGRLHLTVANLSSKLHRAIEGPEMASVLSAIFVDTEQFVVHEPLQGGMVMRDEGAANHTRLCATFDGPAVHVFVHGIDEQNARGRAPKRFVARQTLQASQAVARLNRLDPQRCVFIQQSPEAIDAGVFHNDVIAVGHRNLLVYHERAFVGGDAPVKALQAAFERQTGVPLRVLRVPEVELPLAEAVSTYLFNSQLISLREGGTALVLPAECSDSKPVQQLLNGWLDQPDPAIAEVHYFDLRESMQNGGGPACLRQRIVLTDAERGAIRANVFLTEPLYKQLKNWVRRHYRDHLTVADLADPLLLQESRTALAELTSILNLGNVYEFQ